MNKLNLIVGILIGFTTLSCSSDDNPAPQPTTAESLIQGSPWTFDHYEMINIIDSGNSTFTKTDVENYTNQSQSGNVVTFKNDGTGSSLFPDEGTSNWKWEIIKNDQLKLTFDGGNTDVLENINVSSSDLIIEIQSVSYDEQVQYEVLHYGKFIYK